MLSQADFDEEVRGAAAGPQAGGGGGGGGGEETDGKTLFTQAAQPRVRVLPHARRTRAPPGTTGPNLDEVIPDLSDAEIKQSIQDPDAKITAGFPAGIMPHYGDSSVRRSRWTRW